MEGATLSGKLAAEVVANRAIGNPDKPIKEIQQHIIDAAATYEAKDPVGVKGDGPIAFGGGYNLGDKEKVLLKESDPAQYDGSDDNDEGGEPAKKGLKERFFGGKKEAVAA